MATWMKRASVLGLMAGVGGLLASACADNEQTIFIRQVQAPETECGYEADPSGTAVGIGVLDLALTTEYRGGLLVGNQLVPRANADRPAAETNRVRLTEAEVRVELTTGEEIGSFTVPGTGFIDPGTGSEPSYGMFLSTLVDSASAKVILDKLGGASGTRSSTVGRIVTVVKVFGRTLGGKEVETGEYRFPIEVCYGCLISFPPDANDPTLAKQPNCLKASETGSTLEEPCLVGQDQAVDCRICKSRLGAAGATLCEP